VQNKPGRWSSATRARSARGVTAKDLILGTIGQMSVSGAVGHAVEFAGPAIEALSMEGRMTVCNMTIEGGGRAGMIAPDERTFAWLEERGVSIDPAWRELRTDEGATFDREVVVDAGALSPQVTWGTTPDMVVAVTDAVPTRAARATSARWSTWRCSPARR
jgi:3-isopropylmalate/(R)-2-methylmalate dehydratase large subunit